MIKTAIGLTSGLILASVWYLSPVLKPFPPLTGSYSVGTQALLLVDQRRFCEPNLKNA